MIDILTLYSTQQSLKKDSYGKCESESVDIREEMRFEVILRRLKRLVILEWLAANNVTIMKAFFSKVGNLANVLTAG